MATKVTYKCSQCGRIESELRQDYIQCRCGQQAKRSWNALNIRYVGTEGRWDPVVGEYVRNTREFKDAVKRHKAVQEAKLGMEVKWESVDARDKEGLAELHFTTPEAREADLEPTRRIERQMKTT